MQQAEFLLKKFFIIRPNKHSHYKLRIVINRDAQEQQIKKDLNQYHFKFAPGNGIMFEQPFGAIVLLQKKEKEQKYLQIGKSEVDFNQILMNSSGNGLINGVIYGTRANNNDKAIAKYSYQVTKNQIDPSKIPQIQINLNTAPKIKFKDHIQNDKLPILKFKQSSLQHNTDINNKIKQLSESIMLHNHQSQVTLGKGRSGSVLEERLQSIVQKSVNEKNCCFKINNRVEGLMIEGQLGQLKWMIIKNIKIFQRNSTQKKHVLLKMYDRHHLKLLQIIIDYQSDRNNKIDSFFPITSNVTELTFTATFLQQNWITLNGCTRILHAITKTVELYNEQNEQRGYISMQILKRNQSFDMEQYQQQKKIFNNILKEFPSSTIPLPYISNHSGKLQVAQIYQSYDKKANILINRARTNTQHSQNNHSLSRNKHIQRPKFSLQVSDILSTSHKPKPYSSSATKASPSRNLSLKIKNIYIHLYDHETSQSLKLQFQSQNQAQSITIPNGYSDLQDIQPILLVDLLPKQSIKLNCYSQESFTLLSSNYIEMQTLIQSSSRYLKIFLKRHKNIVGYISCEISLYRIKNNKIKVVRKNSPSTHIYTDPLQQYEVNFRPQTLAYSKSIPRASKIKESPQLGQSFLLEQSTFT